MTMCCINLRFDYLLTFARQSYITILRDIKLPHLPTEEHWYWYEQLARVIRRQQEG